MVIPGSRDCLLSRSTKTQFLQERQIYFILIERFLLVLDLKHRSAINVCSALSFVIVAKYTSLHSKFNLYITEGRKEHEDIALTILYVTLRHNLDDKVYKCQPWPDLAEVGDIFIYHRLDFN